MRDDELFIVQLVRDGFFSIDEQGRIWKHQAFTRARNRKPIPTKRADELRDDGYLMVRVKKRQWAMSHRIVWIFHNGIIPQGKEINHKNWQRSDNALGNLELVTKSENGLHSYLRPERWRPVGERNNRGKLTSTQVLEIRKLFAEGFSHRALGNRFGVSHTSIGMIVRGKHWRDELPEPRRWA